ncbi:polysaccharide biosynthesis C-terminal domain-containing protein [Sphingobacterium psychroaquaticum]|uniref:dTDP-4-dehydrorhamnose 3,5-epimerase n=1 Tax=Sphingobacterium psychroaquaticum TaxID=561061 RepID=A0A1X7K6T2_9SPHI|nr:WxcM-like domain-containing protein [Sphingobacterium psychroaquaticum]QBQ42688.1 hypothetical protein E2P86_16665 [Sphingobacterium psychroaquaticum]SMG36516.1 dTDP-4-dehydrorhamnose 3,5-epimerase [Sphingobacterium psychroaquaticum]
MTLLSKKVKVIPRKIIKDSRGWFLKVIDGFEENLPKYTGEVYITSGIKGESKGGHYHVQANEWFTLIEGKCQLKLVDVKSGEKLLINLSSEIPETIFVPNNVAHIFVNKSDNNFILLAYSDQLFDPVDTIAYMEF